MMSKGSTINTKIMKACSQKIKKAALRFFQKVKYLPLPSGFTGQDSEKGQSFTELAVSMVLLLLLLAGIMDIGRISLYYIAMVDAAEEGVVFGSAYPTHCHQIEDRVFSVLVDPTTVQVRVLIDGVTCANASPSTNACTGNEIEVQITDPDFPITMPFLGTFLGGQTVNLETSVKGTILRPACSGP